MFDRVTLAEDLVDCRGHALGKKGLVLSAESIAEAAARAPQTPRRSRSQTFISQDLHLAPGAAAFRHPFRRAGAQAPVARPLLSVRLPPALYDELHAIKLADMGRYLHALGTAAIAVRMLSAAAGEARALPDLAAAALLHDIGMRHVSVRLARHEDPLRRADVDQVAAHPFVGAYHLACVLGPHPAVDAALSHHWRAGQGYPQLAQPPARSIEVVAVASEFAALTEPRPYRSEPFDSRGAADLLVSEAIAGHADGNTVKLLVHSLRGGSGDLQSVRFARERLGHAPSLNRHTPIAGPTRASV